MLKKKDTGVTYIYLCVALQLFLDFGWFLSFLIYTQSVWLLGRGSVLSQGLYLHIEQHKHRINAHNTDIYALSRIRTHDPSVRRG
jgi:hypothetical protein